MRWSRVASLKMVNPQSMIHLTEIPVELASRAMEYSSKPGKNVLDPLAGSGSSLIAAERSGRRAFLIELDPLYVDVLVQRWQTFTGRFASASAPTIGPCRVYPRQTLRTAPPGIRRTEGGGEPWTTSFTNSHRGSSNPASRTAGTRVSSAIAWQVRTGRCWARSMPSDNSAEPGRAKAYRKPGHAASSSGACASVPRPGMSTNGNRRAAHAQEVQEMNRRHIQEAKALQSKAIQRLKSLDADQLSPSDSLRFCTEATKLERTALGEPETIEEQRLTGTGGGTVHFSLESAVQADRELEEWNHDRLPTPGGPSLPQGDLQVP